MITSCELTSHLLVHYVFKYTYIINWFLVDGGLGEWEEWGPCSKPCGGGDQTRSRRCDNPVPEFGGLVCEGKLTECKRCNLDPCDSQCPAELLEMWQGCWRLFINILADILSSNLQKR